MSNDTKPAHTPVAGYSTPSALAALFYWEAAGDLSAAANRAMRWHDSCRASPVLACRYAGAWAILRHAIAGDPRALRAALGA